MNLDEDLAGAEQRLVDERRRIEAQREVARHLPKRAVELLYMIHPHKLYDQRGSLSATDLKSAEMRELFELLPPSIVLPTKWGNGTFVTIRPFLPEHGYKPEFLGQQSSLLLEIEDGTTWTWWTNVHGDLWEVNVRSNFPWGALGKLGIQLLRSTDQNGNITRDEVELKPPAIKAATRGHFGKWRRREFLFSCDDATVLDALG